MRFSAGLSFWLRIAVGRYPRSTHQAISPARISAAIRDASCRARIFARSPLGTTDSVRRTPLRVMSNIQEITSATGKPPRARATRTCCVFSGTGSDSIESYATPRTPAATTM